MPLFHRWWSVLAPLTLCLVGCSSWNVRLPEFNTGGGSPTGVVTGMRNDTNVIDPDIQGRYPELRRLMVYAIDDQVVGDGILLVGDRTRVPVGEHLLTILGETRDGRRTLSYASLEVAAGANYFLVPVEAEGGLLAAICAGRYGAGEIVRTTRQAPAAKPRTRGAMGPPEPPAP